MRELATYRPMEWLRGLPIKHGFKQHRDDLADRYYSATGTELAEKFLRDHGDLAGKDVLLTIAYNMPSAIDYLLRTAPLHFKPALIIADNSRNPDARRDIAALAAKHDVPYLPLPPNPVRQPSRNHGVSINWMWRNVLKPLKPARFGLWDHDLLPLKTVDMADALGEQPFYGIPLSNDWGWHLWAGYCFFDYEKVADKPLNFSTDLSRKLDTGGRNAGILFNKVDRDTLRFAKLQWVHLKDKSFVGPFISHFVDDHFHISGAAYLSEMPDFLDEMVAATLAGESHETIATRFTEPMDEKDFPYTERQWA